MNRFNDISDFELSKQMIILTNSAPCLAGDVFPTTKSDSHAKLEFKFGRFMHSSEFDINNPLDMWPLIVEHEVDIRHNWDEAETSTALICPTFEWFHKNALRAAAICIIMKLEGKATAHG